MAPVLSGDHFCYLPLAVGLFVSVSALVALCAKHSSRILRNQETETRNSEFPPRSPLASPKHLLTKITDKANGKHETETRSSKFAPRSPLASPKHLLTKITDKANGKHETETGNSKFAPRSPLASPKHLLATIGNKANGKHETEMRNSKFAPRSPLASPKHLLATVSNKAIPFVHKKRNGEEAESDTEMKMEEGFGEGGLWQRSILMGEKCQPPDFSGVIYYDNYGKQVAEMPRSPRASPLHSFSFPAQKLSIS